MSDCIEFEKELNDFEKEYEKTKFKNLCIECGIDLGYMNPRQLCGKIFCYNNIEELSDNKINK